VLRLRDEACGLAVNAVYGKAASAFQAAIDTLQIGCGPLLTAALDINKEVGTLCEKMPACVCFNTYNGNGG
jgi:hypothetical protein